jgi:hypothetical protein
MNTEEFPNSSPESVKDHKLETRNVFINKYNINMNININISLPPSPNDTARDNNKLGI